MAVVLAGLYGLFLCATGAVFFLSPQVAVSVFGADPSHMADLALAPLIGARQIAIGLAIVTLAVYRGAKPLGILMILASLVSAVDYATAAKAFGAIAPVKQLIPLTVSLVLGSVLLARQRPAA